MVRAPIVPLRWVSHRLDIHAYMGGEAPLFDASDIYTALGIPLEYGDYDRLLGRRPAVYPFPTEHVDGVTDRAGIPVEFFTVDQVRELAADRPLWDASEFSEWFDEQLQNHGGDRLENLSDALTHEEPGRAELHAGRTFSVSRAAQLLSRDPAINYGQKALFETLSSYMNWIQRVDGIWVPTREVLRAGYLVRHHVVAGPRKAYPQIRITRAGLEVLHARFGGIAPLTFDTPPPLTLLELS
jgi:hypothetical protein